MPSVVKYLHPWRSSVSVLLEHALHPRILARPPMNICCCQCLFHSQVDSTMSCLDGNLILQRVCANLVSSSPSPTALPLPLTGAMQWKGRRKEASCWPTPCLPASRLPTHAGTQVSCLGPGLASPAALRLGLELTPPALWTPAGDGGSHPDSASTVARASALITSLSPSLSFSLINMSLWIS